MFTYQKTIKMHDTDTAGYLSFGSQFKIAHDAYELFLDSMGFSIAYLLKEADFILQIVQAEADYISPISIGEQVTVKIQLGKLGRSSFKLHYDFVNKKKETVGRVKTVHVAMDKKEATKVALPVKLRNSLSGGVSEVPDC